MGIMLVNSEGLKTERKEGENNPGTDSLIIYPGSYR